MRFAQRCAEVARRVDGVSLSILAGVALLPVVLAFGSLWAAAKPRRIESPWVAIVPRGLGTPSPLEPAPSPEPLTALTWQSTAWLDDHLRLRSMRATDVDDAERLITQVRRARALFPHFAGVPVRTAEPLELRIVQPGVLDDPAHFDLGAHGTLLGVYFPSARVAYVATPPPVADTVVLHELGHYFMDTYELDLDPAVEEWRVERFVTYVQSFERWKQTMIAALRHRAPVSSGGGRREPVAPAGRAASVDPAEPFTFAWPEGTPVATQVFLRRIALASVEVFAGHARLAPRPVARIAIHLREEVGRRHCRATLQERARRVDVWLGGCGYDDPAHRGVQVVASAVGVLLARDYDVDLPDEEKAWLAYGLGAAVDATLRRRPWVALVR